jgi:hypothetical protein
MRALLGNPAQCRTLAYFPGEGFTFAAFDVAGARRSVVVIRDAVISYDMRRVQVSGAAYERADGGVDLEGVVAGEWAVFFHNEPFLARAGLSFAAEKPRELRLLVTGLAPGVWELWRDGWLDCPEIRVRPQHCAAYVAIAGGRYFLRKV